MPDFKRGCEVCRVKIIHISHISFYLMGGHYPMYFVGIDIAKKTHQAAIICSDSKLIGKPFKVSNTIDGFNLFLEKLTAVNTDLSQFEIGMEATGHYWLNLYTWLSDKGFRLHVINPLQSDALRNLYIRKTKTDSVDAKIIADVIRIGQYSETQLADENIIALRDLNRQRFYLVDMAADLKRKIIAMMDRIFPEYQDFFSHMFGTTSVQIMKEYTSPEQILQIPTERLTQLLKKASRGRFTETKAKELKALAANSFAALLSSEMTVLLIRQMLEQLDLLEKQISDIEHIIAAQFAQFDTKLTTIPGIGTTLGATILSEIGDINRFDKPKQLIAYAGIDPSVKQSGNFVGTQSHMSKRGSPYLRRALWLAAVVAVSHDDFFKYLFQQKMNAGKTYAQAMGYICHKLLNTVFAILKTGEEYKPIYPSQLDLSKLADQPIHALL